MRRYALATLVVAATAAPAVRHHPACARAPMRSSRNRDRSRISPNRSQTRTSSATRFPVIAGRAADFSQTAVMSALQTYGGAAGTYSCNPDGGVTSFGRYASLGVDPTSGELFGDAPYVSDGTACAFQTSLVGFYVQDARFADDFPDDGGVAIGGGGGGFPTGDDVPDGGGCGCSTAAPRDAAAPLLVIALGALVSRSRGRARRRADRSR